jgi:hypothetical protein
MANGWQAAPDDRSVDMPWDWPVETNYHEASAFLPLESARPERPAGAPAERRRVVPPATPVTGSGELPDDEPASANMHLDHWASILPGRPLRPRRPLFDVVGNVWQWTETPIYPFDGFDVHPIYDDFTTPTFDDRHNI